MIIDCDRCQVRGNACTDCVVGVFLGVPGVPGRAGEGVGQGVGQGAAAPVQAPGAPAMRLDAPEFRALSVLAEQGLVPRLRLVPGQGGGGSAVDSAERGWTETG